MHALSWMTCLWPGLPRLWWRGDVKSLLRALAFALALNLGVVSSLVWSDSLPSWLLIAGWFAIGVVWIGSAVNGWRSMPMLSGADVSSEREDLFVRAQTEYLNRHWLEAEEFLQELLAKRDQDAEARLLLATLYRHSGRFEEAGDCLTRLERMDGGDRWRVEIARERRLLEIRDGQPMAADCPPESEDKETIQVAGVSPVQVD